jgi:hypothetical protein
MPTKNPQRTRIQDANFAQKRQTTQQVMQRASTAIKPKKKRAVK